MAIPWKAVRGGFLDGLTAHLLMFRKVIRVPGSQSVELMRLTTPEMLAEYRAIGPEWQDAMLKIRDNSLDQDCKYARTVRLLGCLELLSILIAICFLRLHGRL